MAEDRAELEAAVGAVARNAEEDRRAVQDVLEKEAKEIRLE